METQSATTNCVSVPEQHQRLEIGEEGGGVNGGVCPGYLMGYLLILMGTNLAILASSEKSLKIVLAKMVCTGNSILYTKLEIAKITTYQMLDCLIDKFTCR